MSTITGITLSPNDIIGPTNISATLTVNLSSASASTPLITIDPSYIAYLDGNMTSSDGGFTWNGSINRTLGMNLLGNTLTVSIGDISSIFFDVVENSDYKIWSLINSNNVNKEFNQSIQMSPNGLLMGFIDGSNVEIYRKSESSYTWNHDVSYNGHTFALTNNHIVLANNEFLQIYDYSGSSWSIMNGGNIYYLNIIALSINLDGTYVAISNNIDVKVLQNISDNWTHINTYTYASVNGLSLSPNGLKLGMGIGTVGQDYSSILVEDVVNNYPPVITLVGDASINHEINSGSYTDQGATAIEEESMDLTGSIVVSGDTVDVAVLGAYQIYYDVVDARGNNAVRKIRVVNVVDTTNPVVTLIGDAEITINLGDSYTEQGATASDNSNESLTVVISGDTVDVNTASDYTVLYTATDSTGNSHQISRLIHIIPLTLRDSNTDSDLFSDLVDFYTLCPDFYNQTNKTFTVSGLASYLNGDYILENCGTVNNNLAYGMKQLFQASGNYTSEYSRYTVTKNLPGYGYTTGPYDRHAYGGDDARDGEYIGATSSNGDGTFIFYSETDENNNAYNGQYLKFSFPFSYQLKKMYIAWGSSFYSLNKVAVLGSNDNSNYYLIDKYNIIGKPEADGNAYTIDNITNTNHYKHFKIIIQNTDKGTGFNCSHLQFFGYIYK